jgi:hypothetical protein
VRLLGNFATWLAPLPGCWLAAFANTMPPCLLVWRRRIARTCTAAPLHRCTAAPQAAGSMRMQRLIVYCALLGLARRPRIRRDPPIASHSSFASCWLLAGSDVHTPGASGLFRHLRKK